MVLLVEGAESGVHTQTHRHTHTRGQLIFDEGDTVFQWREDGLFSSGAGTVGKWTELGSHAATDVIWGWSRTHGEELAEDTGGSFRTPHRAKISSRGHKEHEL